jgi:hypothetical protein
MRYLRGLLLWGLIASSTLAISIGCGGGSDSSNPGNNTTVTLNGNSASQQAFKSARGIPNLFQIIFARQDFSNGALTQRSSARRIESWLWGSPYNATANFDQGFFVSERALGADAPLGSAGQEPAQFVESTSPDDVIALFGAPDCEEQLSVAGLNARVLKYRDRLLTVSFIGSQIQTVSSGYAYVSTNNPQADGYCS